MKVRSHRLAVNDECRRWDSRYGTADGLFFGASPTPSLVDLVARLRPLESGRRALCLGEGEGRDALFLASAGFEVTAVDGSWVGLEKLRARAEELALSVEIVHADLETLPIAERHYDLIVSLYCHLLPGPRQRLHRAAARGLAADGQLLIEGFSPGQQTARMRSGGPPDSRLLFTVSALRADVEDLLSIEESFEGPSEIEFGRHRGPAVVTRLRGRASSRRVAR